VTHGPAELAPERTGLVARCNVCGVQWQVQSFAHTDAQACQFCGAPASAIDVETEKRDFGMVDIH
jgi:hypothetical protein